MGRHTYYCKGEKIVFTGELKDLENDIAEKEQTARNKLISDKEFFASKTESEKIIIISKKLGLQ